MLITCPECSHSVSDKAIACPSCGYPISLPSEAKKPRKTANTRSRRSKHPKLPNGTGSIKYQKNVKRKPYYAYPPCKKITVDGVPVLDKPIGSYATWYEAYDALTRWKNGDSIAEQPIRHDYTFAEVFELYYKDKYESGGRKYSISTQNADKAAYKNAADLQQKVFARLVKADLQGVVDSCAKRLKHSSLELIVNLFHGMYAFALAQRITDADMSRLVVIGVDDDDEQGVPFSESELRILWENSNLDDVQVILMMIYSGFRQAAYEQLEINTESGYFKGGVKTATAKQRIVPIHPDIEEYAAKFSNQKYKMHCSARYFDKQSFRTKNFYPCLETLGIATAETGEKHTPHDTRHTFSWLCDRYGVDDISKHKLMGHKITGDVEKAKYGHRTFEELRAAISKINTPKDEILANR